MNKKPHLLIFGILFFLVLFYGCKEIDLSRIAAVKTEPVMEDNITENSASVFASIIDLGNEEMVSDFGFCWSMNSSPTINDFYHYFGRTSSSYENYNYTIFGLNSSTKYYLRAYIEAEGEIFYGNMVEFETDENTQPPGSAWLSYDDGFNNDGIGLTEGGSFDAAIRFPTGTTGNYGGYYVSRIKFYVYEDYTTDFSITIWEADPYEDPDLIYVESAYSAVAGQWTEHYLSETYFLQPDKELWVGVWIQNHPVGYYPMGVDAGPAEPGLGDLISSNDGESWYTLSENSLNYNWNIQVYITNAKGNEKQLAINHTANKKLRTTQNNYRHKSTVASKNLSKNQINR